MSKTGKAEGREGGGEYGGGERVGAIREKRNAMLATQMQGKMVSVLHKKYALGLGVAKFLPLPSMEDSADGIVGLFPECDIPYL